GVTCAPLSYQERAARCQSSTNAAALSEGDNGVPAARNTRGCGHVRPQCGRTPLDGITQGVTVELFACPLIRQNSTGRHEPEPGVTNPRGLVMRRSRVRIPEAAQESAGQRPKGPP